nr:PREDICTED: uncharacterized protein LOC100560209 isoform X1 [Anolis carolinensis]|eukprot:XP_008120970.1 PREDICTED: uncharacterized protein LOC100560209 isoform X1 [Anolis carolinensis]
MRQRGSETSEQAKSGYIYLSQCFQGCSLRNRKKEFADLQRHRLCRENPGLCHLRHSLTGKGRASEGLRRKQDGSRPSVAVSSSARILPQCQLSHVQRCRACQAFNRDQNENGWAPLQEEGPVGASEAHRNVRTSLSSERLGKVQHWLEQTWEERPPEPDCRRLPKQRTQRPELCPAYGGQKERETWSRDAGDDRRVDSTVDTRHRWRSHPGENCQAPARMVPRGDASPSPATCTCLFCEQQRPRATLVSGKNQRDPSVAEVAVLLQAEKRVPRIVEAFERRTRWEAKMAQEEQAFMPTGRREMDKPTRGHRRSSSAVAHRAHGREEEERGHHRESRARVPRGKAATQPRRCPSFIDRLRGIH